MTYGGEPEWSHSDRITLDAVRLRVKRAVLKEREACAKAAEDVVPRHTECGNKIAAAIRARGKE